MKIRITKGLREDQIAVWRDDGTAAESTFPHKGPVPHDAVHFHVERELGMKNAFWGMVASGHHPEDVGAIAKAAGHASASRAEIPEAHIVELLQAERLVECFEAELWSAGTGGDAEAFLAVAQAACEYSHVPLPPITAQQIERIRFQLDWFAEDWLVSPPGHICELPWDVG